MGWSTRTVSGPNPLRERSKLYVAVVALVAVLGATGAAMAAREPGGDGQLVIAEFSNVGPLLDQTQVKIAGVRVGQTGAPALEPERRIATVPLEFNQDALPLHTDATATIRQISLIGEKYVDVYPGSPSAPVLKPGMRIPVAQTSYANDYQNIVQTLNDPTAAGLSSLARTFGSGIAGRGKNVQEILKRWGPNFRDTAALADSLARQNDLLGQVIDQVQPVANGLADDGGRTLDRTVGSATSLLGTTAANEAKLRETIKELPSTLSAAQATLDQLTGTATQTESTLRELRPTSDNLAAISRELRGFTDSAKPALRSANPLLDRANELLDEARPLAAELERTGDPLYDTVHRLRPVTTSLTNNLGGPYGSGPDRVCGDGPTFSVPGDPDCRNPRIQGVLGFLHNWSLVTNNGDALNHYFRVFLVADTNDPLGGLPAAIPGVGNPQNTVLEGDAAPGGSATGLNPAQEQNALGYLMGGQ